MTNLNELNNDAKNKAKDLYNEGKNEVESLTSQLANNACNLYEEGKKKINQIEDKVSDYSDELITKVKEQPLSSLLVAGGVGFLLSLLLNK
ncbi:MAG: DUF883 family protein [Tatlockia sp.]|nr:DUF883 family protein [Tatlockia sp.]